MTLAFARPFTRSSAAQRPASLGAHEERRAPCARTSPPAPSVNSDAKAERQLAALIAHLRRIVVHGPGSYASLGGRCDERFHAVFLDEERGFVGETSLGQGSESTLSLRLRDLFTHALGVRAASMIIAHNHPSGDSRPSRCDIEATCRVSEIANALDIELLDHLIFTESAVYSMRAGDNL